MKAAPDIQIVKMSSCPIWLVVHFSPFQLYNSANPMHYAIIGVNSTIFAKKAIFPGLQLDFAYRHHWRIIPRNFLRNIFCNFLRILRRYALCWNGPWRSLQELRVQLQKHLFHLLARQKAQLHQWTPSTVWNGSAKYLRYLWMPPSYPKLLTYCFTITVTSLWNSSSLC